MGSSHARKLAELANGAADFVAAYPEAAAWFARRLGQILSSEACHAEEAEHENREDLRRRGMR